MEVSYHREMKKNYLMIEADEESMQAFEAKMLVGNAIEGLLKFRIRRTETAFGASFGNEIHQCGAAPCSPSGNCPDPDPHGRLSAVRTSDPIRSRLYLYRSRELSARSVSASWKEWQFSRRIQRIFTVFTGESRPSG